MSQTYSRRRQHITNSGKPKVSYLTLIDANNAVLSNAADGRVGLQSYVCEICEKYHLGNPPRPHHYQRSQETLRDELGERAFRHLKAENRRSKRIRTYSVLARWEPILRHALQTGKEATCEERSYLIHLSNLLQR